VVIIEILAKIDTGALKFAARKFLSHFDHLFEEQPHIFCLRVLVIWGFHY
jgi:hypothetical protein